MNLSRTGIWFVLQMVNKICGRDGLRLLVLAEATYVSRTELAKSPSVFLTIAHALPVFMFV